MARKIKERCRPILLGNIDVKNNKIFANRNSVVYLNVRFKHIIE